MLVGVLSITELGILYENSTPQQANTQRMRLQMCSNPKVDEGGQHPLIGDRYEGSNPNDFFSLCVYLYSYTRIWVRVGTGN